MSDNPSFLEFDKEKTEVNTDVVSDEFVSSHGEDCFSLKLQTPIKVHGVVDGANTYVDCDTIYLQAPTARQVHQYYTVQFKQLYFQAQNSIAMMYSKEETDKLLNGQDGSSKKDENISAKQILAVLYLAKDFDLVSLLRKFDEFLVSGICFTDLELKTRIKPSYLEKVSLEDKERLLSEYIRFFFIVSWMKMTQGV
jgi:hypothetical protein